jgi:DNA-binding NarL/FixJ family response regulator
MGDMASRYMEGGAAGVVSKSAALSQFVRCVREAMKHKAGPVKVVGPVLVKPQVYPLRPPTRPADTLTQREKSVIACLMQGLPNREISRRLSIAEQTVKNHLRSIFDKVGVSDRLELVLYAVHQKLGLPLIEAEREQATGTGS